jgi:esterase/lipase
MPELNKMISDANEMRKNVLKNLQEYMTHYALLEKEVQNRFQDEYSHNNHKLNGLEDFHQLSYICKKNFGTVRSACNLMARMSDLSGFDISEHDELVKELDEILKD